MSEPVAVVNEFPVEPKPEATQSSISGKDDLSREPSSSKSFIKPLLAIACIGLLAFIVVDFFPLSNSSESGEVNADQQSQETLKVSVDDFAVVDNKSKNKTKAKVKSAKQKVAISVKAQLSSYTEELLPIELISIDEANFFCSFKIKKKAGWLSEVLTLSQAKQGLKLISIEKDNVVIDFNEQAYRLYTNQRYVTDFELDVQIGQSELVFRANQLESQGYELVDRSEGNIVLEKSKSAPIKLEVTGVNQSPIIVGGAMREQYLKQSLGVVASFRKFDHQYFPIIVNSVAKDSINYSMYVNGAVVNYGMAAKSAVLAKRYQLTFVGSDWILLKDVKTAKNIRLKVKQKVILDKSAQILYRNRVHKVSDGETFFGYQIKVTEAELSFYEEENNFTLSSQRLLTFLPIIKAGSSEHRAKDCGCYQEEAKSSVLMTKLMESKKKAEEVEKTAVIKPEQERVEEDAEDAALVREREILLDAAKRKTMNLEHLMMFSTIRVSHRTFSSANSSSTSPIGHYLYKDGELSHAPGYKGRNEIALEHFEVTPRSFKIKGIKAKYERLRYYADFQVVVNKTEHYAIDFVPNNYFTLKKLERYMRVSFSNGYYYFGEKYGYIGSERKKIRTKFDDDSQQIFIDKIPYALEYSHEYVYLVDPNGDKGIVYFDDEMFKLAR